MNAAGLQETFLNTLRCDRIPATFYFTNGYQMKGILSAFDPFTLLITSDGRQKLLFKHAVSTIMPDRKVIGE